MKRRRFLGLAAITTGVAGCLRTGPRTPQSRRVPSATPVATSQTGDARGAEVAWARRYGVDGGKETSTPGGSGIFPVSVARAAGNGFALGGGRSTRDATHAVLFRTDSEGRKQWYEAYGGRRRDEINGMLRTTDGGYLLLGTDGMRDASNVEQPTTTPAPTRTRAWAVRVAPDGTKQWEVHPVEGRQAVLTDAVQLEGGGFALSGWTVHDTGRAGLLVRVDPEGSVTSRDTYNSEDDGPTREMPASGTPAYKDMFTAVCRGDDGGVVLGGENTRGGWVIHVNDQGTIRWELDLEYPQDIVRDVSRAANGGYVATGRLYDRSDNEHTVTDTRNPSDLYLMRIGPRGSTQWVNAYDGGRNEIGERVIRTSDGGFAVAGGSITQRYQDLFLVKTNGAGELKWSERFEFSSTGGGSAEEPWEIPTYGNDILEITDGEYVVAAGGLFLKVLAVSQQSTTDGTSETRTGTDSTTRRTVTDHTETGSQQMDNSSPSDTTDATRTPTNTPSQTQVADSTTSETATPTGTETNDGH